MNSGYVGFRHIQQCTVNKLKLVKFDQHQELVRRTHSNNKNNDEMSSSKVIWRVEDESKKPMKTDHQ